VRDDRLVQGAEGRLLVLGCLRQNRFDPNLIRIHPTKVQSKLFMQRNKTKSKRT
jgi:hypothetical protein